MFYYLFVAEVLQSAKGEARFRPLEEAMSLSSCCAWTKVVECSCWFAGWEAVFCSQLLLRCMRTRSMISVWKRPDTVTGSGRLSRSQKSRPSCWTMFVALTQWHSDLRSSSEILQLELRPSTIPAAKGWLVRETCNWIRRVFETRFPSAQPRYNQWSIT